MSVIVGGDVWELSVFGELWLRENLVSVGGKLKFWSFFFCVVVKSVVWKLFWIRVCLVIYCSNGWFWS